MEMRGTIPLMGDPDRRTVPQVCDELGVSESTVFRYVKQGMPSYLVAGQRVFRQPEVIEWLTEKSQQKGNDDE